MSKRTLPLPRADPRWARVIELHAKLARKFGSLGEADRYLTEEFRKEPLEGIRTMRDPPQRPGGRDLPEEELSTLEWLDGDAERDLPEAGLLLHEWFRGREIQSFAAGVVCAYPLHQPLRLMELRDFYAWLPDCKIKDLPADTSPWAPVDFFAELAAEFELPGSDNRELVAAIKQLPTELAARLAAALKWPTPGNPELAAVLEQLPVKLAAALKPASNKDSQNKVKSLRRQQLVGQAILRDLYPEGFVPETIDTKIVFDQLKTEWRSKCGELLKDERAVDPPNLRTVARWLGRNKSGQKLSWHPLTAHNGA